MSTELHIGNVSAETTRSELSDLFATQGQVSDVRFALDGGTGRPRGFAFVTMATPEGARAAMEGLNGEILRGRFITVNPAHPRERGTSQEARDLTNGPRRSHRQLY